MATKSEKERLAVIETKMDSVEKSVSKLHEKFDKVMEEKADKSRVDKIEENLNGLKLKIALYTGGAVVIFFIIQIFVQKIIGG